ncbi:Hypothetical protein D9617_18g034810 [Elsinoe fawcettii]|nr:Hypothetical protein D9617_18g034810 [Elsinoe fawcettii]
MHTTTIVSGLLAGQAAAAILPRNVVTVTEVHTNTVVVPYTGKPAPAPTFRPAAPMPRPNNAGIDAILGAFKGVKSKNEGVNNVVGALNGVKSTNNGINNIVSAFKGPQSTKDGMNVIMGALNGVKTSKAIAGALKGVPTPKPDVNITKGPHGPPRNAPSPAAPPPPPPPPPAAPPKPKITLKTFMPGLTWSPDDEEDDLHKRAVEPAMEEDCTDTVFVIRTRTVTVAPNTSDPATTTLKMYTDNPNIVDSTIATKPAITSGLFHNVTLPVTTETTVPTTTTTMKHTSTIKSFVTVPKSSTTTPSQTPSTASSTSTSNVATFTNPWDVLKPSNVDESTKTAFEEPEKSDAPVCIFPLPGAPGC